VLAGKRVDRTANHIFTYSRIARCGSCGYSLIAERQKGHVYYRCHDRPFKSPAHCPPTSIREEELDEAVLACLRDIDLSDDELALARACAEEWKKERAKNLGATTNVLRLQLDQMQDRLEKLADALVDGTIDKGLFQNKQNTLLQDRARIKEQLAEIEKGGDAALANLENTVELAKSPSTLYKAASSEEKRQLLKTMLSNLSVSEKNVAITLTLPFRLISERDKTSVGRPHRGTCRTWEETITQLKNSFEDTPQDKNIKTG
jgi:site-specific DNA recombinase